MTKFDPFDALKHMNHISDEIKNAVREAIDLIENDSPNAARRLLIAEVLEGSAARRVTNRAMQRQRESADDAIFATQS